MSCGFIRSLTLPHTGGMGWFNWVLQSSIRALGAGVSTWPPVRLQPPYPRCECRTARQINSRLDGNNHAGEQPGCLSGADARRLVNLQAETMAGGVGKCLRQSCLAQNAAGCLVHLRAAYARATAATRPPGPPAPPRMLALVGLWACPGRRFGSYPSSNP
jgi:hypothetical protein